MTGRDDAAGRADPALLRLVGTMARVPAYVRLGFGLVREPAVPPGRKAALVAALAYVVSPIDLIPGLIPVAGQLDDLAVLLIGVRRTLDSCPPAVAQAHLDRAGVSLADLDADLATVRDTGAWLLERGASLGARAIASGFRLLRRAVSSRRQG